MKAHPPCPRCQSPQVLRNGSIHTGKRKLACKECGRQFVEQLEKKLIAKETWELVDTLLLERISMAGIARVTGISESYLQSYVNTKYEQEVDWFEQGEKKVQSHLKKAAIGPERLKCNAMNCALS